MRPLFFSILMLQLKMTVSELNNRLAEVVAHSNIGFLVETLKQVGKIDDNFNISPIRALVNHKSPEVRTLAVKILARINDKNNTDTFIEVYKKEKDTTVKREAISAIGRQRRIENLDFLLSVLEDSDPKIVCQAIRALLVFKGSDKVDKVLKELVKHDNEMVRQVIEKEYFASEPSRVLAKPHIHVDKRLTNTIVLGDVLDIVKYVDDDSVHLTFTSPPYYNARDYSIYKSYEAYLEFLRKTFEETYRITKEGRFLIVNTSPVIVPRISRAHSSKRYPIPFDLHALLVKMGWEFIDDIVWEKPEYSVRNRIGGFRQHRKPLAYKPNNVTEYLMVYRKKTDKLLDWNMRQYNARTTVDSKVKNDFETTNIWKIHPKSDRVHPAIFPVELCKRVISYYSYKGDLVFDPFAGSGTLGRTAKMLGRKFFLTEKEPQYFEYMKSLLGKDSFLDESPTRFLSLDEFKGETK